MGRQLDLPAMYVERVRGKFQLRRGFELKKNQPVLMVEDYRLDWAFFRANTWGGPASQPAASRCCPPPA